MAGAMLRAAFLTQFATAGFGLAATVALNLVLARLLGPEHFGLYALAVAVQHFALVFQEGGFRTLLFRENARATQDFGTEEPEILAQGGGHAILATSAALLVATPIFAGQGAVVLLCVWAAVLGGLTKAYSGFVSGALFGRGLFVKEARWQFWSRLFLLAVGTVAAALIPNAVFVLVVMTIGQAIPLLPRFHSIPVPRPGRLRQRSVNAFSARLIATALFTSIYFRAGPLLIYWQEKNTADLAFYALAHRFLDAAILMVGPVAQLVFFSDRLSLHGRYRHVAPLLGVAWVAGLTALAVLVFLLGAPAVRLVLGEDYVPVVPIAAVFLIALVVAGPNYLQAQLLLARGAENRVMVSSGLTALLSLPITLAGIAWDGALGAAMALVASELILCFCLSLTLLWVKPATSQAMAGTA